MDIFEKDLYSAIQFLPREERLRNENVDCSKWLLFRDLETAFAPKPQNPRLLSLKLIIGGIIELIAKDYRCYTASCAQAQTASCKRMMSVVQSRAHSAFQARPTLMDNQQDQMQSESEAVS